MTNGFMTRSLGILVVTAPNLIKKDVFPNEYAEIFVRFFIPANCIGFWLFCCSDKYMEYFYKDIVEPKNVSSQEVEVTKTN